MRQIMPVLLTVLTFFCWGCGSSDNFVFTNTGPVAGVPTQLAFVQNPAQTTNTDFSTPPIVEVQDAFGNRVPGATNTITVSLVNPGTAVLNGQTTRDAVDGRATFTGLSVSEVGTFTLTCTAQGLASANSASFTVTPNLALYALAQVSGNMGMNPTQLIQLDPSTGEYSGTLGFIAAPGVATFQDLECLPDGTLYAVGADATDDSQLVQVNLSNPSASTVLGEITGVDFIYSLAYDSNNQILYGIAEPTGGGISTLCTINTTTFVATPTPMDLGPAVPDSEGLGLAFDDNTSTLYHTDSDSLFTVDTTTGVATEIGGGSTIGLAVDKGIRGLDFNPTTHQLFGISRGESGVSSNISFAGTINTNNGSSVTTGNAPPISGLTFCANSTIPAAGPARQTGYTVSGITQAFEDISGTGTPLNYSDDDSSLESIGFTFNFNGTDYTNIDINSNGTASFNGSSSRYESELLASDLIPGETLCLFWDDLDPGAGGDVFIETLGTAPNRRFVIQWAQVAHNALGGPEGIDAEIILYEGTNVIEFHYADVTFGDAEFDNGKNAVVGIQTSTTTSDIWSIFEAVLTNTTAIRFTP
jgi:hypothetical protein